MPIDPARSGFSAPTIDDEPAAALSRMGIVFQQPTLDLDLTVEQNLRYHGALHGLPRAGLSLALPPSWTVSASLTVGATRHVNSAAGNVGALRSPARCCTTPSCCSWMSPLSA